MRKEIRNTLVTVIGGFTTGVVLGVGIEEALKHSWLLGVFFLGDGAVMAGVCLYLLK